jgi:hypothetical protein
MSEENVILVLKCYCLLKLKCADLPGGSYGKNTNDL